VPRATVRTSDIDACGLTLSELQELWLGPAPGGSLFRDRQELEGAWAQGRAVVMRLWGRGGRRPAGYYEFEFDGPRPAYAVERSTLWRMPGVLSAEERSELEVEWKAAFAAARGMGAQERREHYAHHDIPHELIEAWVAACRRPRRQAAASQEEAAAPK